MPGSLSRKQPRSLSSLHELCVVGGCLVLRHASFPHSRARRLGVRGAEHRRGGHRPPPVLMSHPAVRDAVCFGVEDEKYGELVAAAVTLGRDTEVRDLIEHCRQQLAAFKVPTRIHVLAQIPRTATGKVQRRRVAEFVAQRSAGQ